MFLSRKLCRSDFFFFEGGVVRRYLDGVRAVFLQCCSGIWGSLGGRFVVFCRYLGMLAAFGVVFGGVDWRI